jgi:phage protein D
MRLPTPAELQAQIQAAHQTSLESLRQLFVNASKDWKGAGTSFNFSLDGFHQNNVPLEVFIKEIDEAGWMIEREEHEMVGSMGKDSVKVPVWVVAAKQPKDSKYQSETLAGPAHKPLHYPPGIRGSGAYA